MAKSKVSVDDLVRAALLKLANAGEAKLTGKGDGLFASAAGANKEAIAKCRDTDPPLVAVVRKEEKSEVVTLTRAGFELIAVDLQEEMVGTTAKAVASAISPASRVEFIQAAIRRTPLAAAELTPLLEEAVAAEKAEQEARVAAAAKRRAAEEAARRALERAMELFEERRRNRLDALRREWEAEGRSAAELAVADGDAAARGGGSGEQVQARTTEERDFRRDVANQLASSWRAAWDAKKDEPRDFLESAMWNVSGLKLVGEPGARVAFDGRLHECKSPASSGESVRVVRPGWVLEEGERDYVVLKAAVEAA